VIVSINQPAYLPWLGYFQRIAVSDVHIVLDHVQFEKNSFTNRNKVRTAQGGTWLTVPVKTKGRFGELSIADLEIDTQQDWRRRHWNTIRQAYARAPHFAAHEQFFAGMFSQEWTKLAPLCQELTGYLLDQFQIKTRMLYSSAMEPTGTKDELILELCRSVGATTYFSGALGRDYLREPLFAEAGIKVVYQDYQHPVYAQQYQPFEPYMAAADLLFNCGAQSGELLTAGQKAVSA